MEEDFTIEAYHAADQWDNQASDQKAMLPHTRFRAVFNDLSSTHSSPTEVSLRFESHEDGLDYLTIQRVASQRVARGIKRQALSPRNKSPPMTLRTETKSKGKVTTVSSAGKSQARPQQTKHLKSFEALMKRPNRVPYPESDSSDSEHEGQQDAPKTEMDAIKEASGFVHVLPYPVNPSYRY
jgi:hypothetical protein